MGLARALKTIPRPPRIAIDGCILLHCVSAQCSFSLSNRQRDQSGEAHHPGKTVAVAVIRTGNIMGAVLSAEYAIRGALWATLAHRFHIAEFASAVQSRLASISMPRTCRLTSQQLPEIGGKAGVSRDRLS